MQTFFRTTLLSVVLLLGLLSTAQAHKVVTAQVTSELDTVERSYRLEIRVEVEASDDAATNDEISPEDAALTVAREEFSVWIDGVRATPEISLLRAPFDPFAEGEEDQDEADADAGPTVLTPVLVGPLPPDASRFSFKVGDEVEFTVIHALAKDGVLARRLEILYPGESSREVDISSGSAPPAGPAPSGEAVGSEPPPSPGFFASMFDWGRLGYKHVVSWDGIDHILFILGLFFLARRFGPLLWQVTAFTLAHTITLALGHFGVVQLPSSIVEPLIAASIAYVAIENLLSDKARPWRYAVVFLLGLLHGMGFAGQLAGYPMPEGAAIPALASFNIGVEVGQLLVIAYAAGIFAWFWNERWYRKLVVLPACTLIAAVALFWTAQRIGLVG